MPAEKLRGLRGKGLHGENGSHTGERGLRVRLREKGEEIGRLQNDNWFRALVVNSTRAFFVFFPRRCAPGREKPLPPLASLF